MFKARLDQIVDMQHPLAKTGAADRLGFSCRRVRRSPCRCSRAAAPADAADAGAGDPLAAFNLSEEALCDRWLEKPYYQLFDGEEFFRHDLPFDRSSMTRWRQRLGEDKAAALSRLERFVDRQSHIPAINNLIPAAPLHIV